MAIASTMASFLAANAATISAVSTAASVASTAYSFYAQSQAANAQAQALSEQNKAIAAQAVQSYDDLTPAEIDAQRNAADQEIQQQAEAMQAKGRINLFAAASGTAGQSVDTMLFDVDAIRARNTNEILRQREAGLTSIKQQAEQIRQGAISGQSKQAISKPSWLEAGFAIGSQAVKGASDYADKYKSVYSKQERVTSRSSV